MKTTDFVLVADAEIERMADLAAKHARERTLMAGRHENERRELARMHQQELQAASSPRPPATPAPEDAAA
jgi:hypothetical protein